MQNVNNDRAIQILKRQDSLEAKRGNWTGTWREIDNFVAPQPDLFNGNRPVGGTQKTEFIFDSTATLCLDMFSAAMESIATPRTQRWHKLSSGDPLLDKNHDVQVYLDSLCDILFSIYNNPRGNFASQTNEVYRSVGKFGTGCIFIDDAVGDSIRFKSVHLSEIFIAENSVGLIDTVFRKFQFTAYQAADFWGVENLPEVIVKSLDKDPDMKFWFVHAVQQNKDWMPGRLDYKGMMFSSVYVSVEGKQIVSEGGYRTFPYAVLRYYTNTNEEYGRSPVMDVMPDIKTLQKIERSCLRADEMTTNPPILLPDEMQFTGGFASKPGALNYGGMSQEGRQLAMPLQIGANTQVGNDRANQKRELINSAMKIKLFQVLVQTPNMTATEAMYRQQEKGALLAPLMGRIQAEFLGPIIERVIDILAHAGMFPEMPDALVEREGNIDIQYQGPLHRAQMADEGIGIMNTLQTAASIAQYDPTILKLFKYDVAMRKLAIINGAPADMIKSDEEVAADKEAEAQQQQLQQIMQAAPEAANTAKTLAETQRLASQPSPSFQ